MQKGGHFRMSFENISFLMKKVDMDFKKWAYSSHTLQRWARIRTGSDWIRTEANFGRIKTVSDCNFFENWRIRTGSDWENFCCFNV